MSNGSVIKEIKDLVVEKGQELPAEVRDRFILSALVEIYAKIEPIDELKRFKTTAEKIFWLVISPLFIAIGTGLVILMSRAIE